MPSPLPIPYRVIAEFVQGPMDGLRAELDDYQGPISFAQGESITWGWNGQKIVQMPSPKSHATYIRTKRIRAFKGDDTVAIIYVWKGN